MTPDLGPLTTASIYAQDLATACIQTLEYSESDLFHIGSENVASLRQVYEAVIAAAGTQARVAALSFAGMRATTLMLR